MSTAASTQDQGQLWQVRVGGTSIGVVAAEPAAGSTRTFTVSCDGNDPSSTFLALDARLGQRVVAAHPRQGHGRPRDELAWVTLAHVHLPDWDSTGKKASVRCVVTSRTCS